MGDRQSKEFGQNWISDKVSCEATFGRVSTWMGDRQNNEFGQSWISDKASCVNNNFPPTIFYIPSQNKNVIKQFAPGEARTHGLQIMRLTRCLLRYGGNLFD